jgi:hypothetical protein
MTLKSFVTLAPRLSLNTELKLVHNRKKADKSKVFNFKLGRFAAIEV